jgi:transcriptional regulator MraZ
MDTNPLRHPVFFGEFELMLDGKNRLPIPAAVRKQIDPEVDGAAFFLVFVESRRPWLYPMNYYRERAAAAPMQETPGKEERDFDRRRFGLASLLEWDKQGRILIPERVMKRCLDLGREVTLVGAKDHLELWNRLEWDAERERLLAE